MQIDDPDAADALAKELNTALGARFEALSWGELLPVLKRLEAYTGSITLALATFVYFLVGLGILNTMLMSVLERTREFGVLMALGTRPSRVLHLVLAESFWIATLSAAGGALTGGLLAWYFSHAGINFVPGTESYQFEGATISSLIKTRFSPAEIARATAFVYVMALIVGLYPASRITRLLPAEALRKT